MKEIFVFGSNLRGVHGAGAARHAFQEHGAIMGQGIGLQGSSYGIPTKDMQIRTLPLGDICNHVQAFLTFTQLRPDLRFNVTRIGCGLAGYKDEDIAPLFSNVAYGTYPNVRLPQGWRQLIREGYADKISDAMESPFPALSHDFSNINELSDSPPPSPEEELAEAKAHGFVSPQEFYEYLKQEYDKDDLWDADPLCSHDIHPVSSGGVKCSKCRGWKCF